MKLKELFEAPQLIKKELQGELMRPFYSEDTLERSFEVVQKGHSTEEDKDYWVVLRKDKSTASIGFPGPRESDQKPGMEIITTIEFKPKVTLSGIKDVPVQKHFLQVDLVRTSANMRARGWGFRLYTALVNAGYVIVSDNTQYLGGQALWKKIARKTLQNKYKVHVFDHGELRKDEHGDPVTYDSANIDDSELWSENADKKYTLFALQKA